MFGGEASDKKVKVLSGGEKTRLAMIKLLLEPVNLLILDEPTNHLDMRTKDILKDAIKDFDGTVIVVSHDRYFLDGLVSKVYEFGGGQVKENLGGIYDFLRKKNISSMSQLEAAPSLSQMPSNNAEASTAAEEAPAQSQGALSYAEQKERDKRLKRAEKAVKTAEDKISQIEQQQADIEGKLSAGDSSSETLETYASLSKQLEEAMTEWEEAQENLESLQQLQ